MKNAMKTKGREKEILHKALETLERTTELTAEVLPNVLQEPNVPDALIRITWQDMEWYFAIEVKNTLTRATVGGTVQQLQKYPERGLLVTQYITAQIADILKEMDIPFIDTAGNAYINAPPLFIFIKGNKPIELYPVKPPTRAFRPTGLQVVFALLCNPGLENATFRGMAEIADVALGTVGWVIRDLKQMGYLVDMGKRGRRLIQKEKLLRRWVTTYPEQLKPKKLIGKFKTPNTRWWEDTELPNLRVFWGGEIAAAKLTQYLKPQFAIIYTDGLNLIGKWLIKNRLRKDPEGDIEIIKTFWKFEYKWEHPNLVHPLLIYADLIATGDVRNIETARIIYDREITRFIRED